MSTKLEQLIEKTGQAEQERSEQTVTYVEHLAAAQVALDEIETHANPLYQAAISQAHALAAIGLLLELLLGAVEQERAGEETPYRIVRIVGGMEH